MATTEPESAGGNVPPASADPKVDELEAGLAQTREELGETIDALSAKLDVKARAGQGLQHARESATAALGRTAASATDDDGRPTPEAVLLALAGVAAFGVLLVLLARRRR